MVRYCVRFLYVHLIIIHATNLITITLYCIVENNHPNDIPFNNELMVNPSVVSRYDGEHIGSNPLSDITNGI